jgi:hypothetical protein
VEFAALGYSVISPIINGLACATFFAFYMLYKYLFLWDYEMERSSDTGGLFYPKAMQHVFVGLYINEVRGCNIVDMRILMHDVQICLFALFLLARDPVAKKQIAIPEAIIMLLLILFTVSCCQTLIGPQLTLFLPGILPVDNQRLIWSSDQPVATDTCGQSFLRPTLRRSWWSGGCC